MIDLRAEHPEPKPVQKMLAALGLELRVSSGLRPALVALIECPRGQMGFYIVGNDAAEPLRARAKSSCFCNLSVTAPMCQGVLIADVPAIVGSLDIVMGEIDR